MRSRKDLYSTILNIEFLKGKYQHAAKDIIRLTSQDEYAQNIKHYDQLIASLKQELLLLPVGYRYTGIFYIRNVYNIPTTFTKYDGSVYMREDLVSWQIEKGPERPNRSYHRNIYKEPQEGCELKRTDAEPVFRLEKLYKNIFI